MEIVHVLLEALLNSILITGLVVVMMMMIESFNIESHGAFFNGLKRSRIGQVVIAAFLGMVPGCMGGFAVVSLYTHGLMSFGALIAMLIATSGDESFVMLAMFPDKALWLMLLSFAIAVVAGIVTDILHRKKEPMHCNEGFEVHEDNEECCHEGHDHEEGSHTHIRGHRHFGWKRIVMFIGVAVFIGALAGGLLEHEHEEEAGSGMVEGISEVHDFEIAGIDLLSEDWMNVLFAALSVIVLAVLVFGNDHFVEEHLWNHIIRRHLPGIFAWTFGVLAVIGLGLHFFDLAGWVAAHKGFTALMIVLAALIGIIPESGPHLVFVTLFAVFLSTPSLAWQDFFPVILASCISQDGHAAIPLLAESKQAFVKAKGINCIVAFAVGFIAWGIIALI